MMLLLQAAPPPAGGAIGPLGWMALASFGVLVAFFVGAAAVMKIHAWYRDSDGPADGDEMFLLALHDSQREGVVSPDEFRSIQSTLAGRRTAEDRSDVGDGDLPIADRLLAASGGTEERRPQSRLTADRSGDLAQPTHRMRPTDPPAEPTGPDKTTDRQ